MKGFNILLKNLKRIKESTQTPDLYRKLHKTESIKNQRCSRVLVTCKPFKMGLKKVCWEQLIINVSASLEYNNNERKYSFYKKRLLKF